MRSADWASLVGKYEAVQETWVYALNKASRMELDEACGQIRHMVVKAKKFRAMVLSVLDDLTNVRCKNTAGRAENSVSMHGKYTIPLEIMLPWCLELLRA